MLLLSLSLPRPTLSLPTALCSLPLSIFRSCKAPGDRARQQLMHVFVSMYPRTCARGYTCVIPAHVAEENSVCRGWLGGYVSERSPPPSPSVPPSPSMKVPTPGSIEGNGYPFVRAPVCICLDYRARRIARISLDPLGIFVVTAFGGKGARCVAKEIVFGGYASVGLRQAFFLAKRARGGRRVKE